ncbi:MAG TPA: flavodoxin domain-containing protein [Candidatus Limnocylindrales bacterium]|jgi:menaquinone-dependent protoporphyrinogen oxidase
MSRTLIVHASRHGGTAGIAERIGEVMRAAGVDAVVAAAADLPDPVEFDACLVGGGVYMGSWVKEGMEYLQRYAPTLESMPVWLFSSGPLPGSTKEPKGAGLDPIERALGPASGPGSGGRRKIEELVARIRPREHRVFNGVFDPADSPKVLSERVLRLLPGSRGILPPGDFRDWPGIEAWARSIAAELARPVAVAGAGRSGS